MKMSVVEGSAEVAGGANDSGDVVFVGINVSLSYLGVIVDLRSNDVSSKAVRGTPKMC